jgi:hypothetical protein
MAVPLIAASGNKVVTGMKDAVGRASIDVHGKLVPLSAETGATERGKDPRDSTQAPEDHRRHS